MTPKTRNILLGLLAAVAAALTAYLQGCTPAQQARAAAAADQTECIAAAAKPALDAPKELSLSQALEIRAAIQACLAAPAADAGAQ